MAPYRDRRTPGDRDDPPPPPACDDRYGQLPPPARRHPGRREAASSGNVGLIVALAATTLICVAAGAVDFGEWLRKRSMTRAAIDNALISGLNALQIQRRSHDEAMTSALETYAVNVQQRGSVLSDTIAFTTEDGGTAVVATGAVHTRPLLLRLFGIDSIPVVDFARADAAKAIRTVGVNAVQSLESVLVAALPSRLDAAALDGLRVATGTLAELVVWPDGNGHTSRLGLVPFASAVNAGALADLVSSAPLSAVFSLVGGIQARLSRTSCVAERLTDSAARDTSPLGADRLTSIFGSTRKCRPEATVLLPTADLSLIRTVIGTLATGGGAAGHIGLAWAWYLLSPNWGGVLPFKAAPAPYDATRPARPGAVAPVRKAVVVIADGGFDTQSCNSALPAGPGLPALSDAMSARESAPRADCLSPNGPAARQAIALCEGMKAAGLSVFTITYPADSPATDAALMRNCASSRDAAFKATTPAELLSAVRDIAMRLTTLLVTK